MGYYVKAEAPCVDCGTPTQHRRSHSRVPVCLTCGIGRAARNIRDQSSAASRRVKRERRLL